MGVRRDMSRKQKGEKYRDATFLDSISIQQTTACSHSTVTDSQVAEHTVSARRFTTFPLPRKP